MNMHVAIMEIREERSRSPETDFGTKNALARIVRRRWPGKTVAEVMAAWGLTDGEARGVVYAQASQATIDKIKRHPNGGWRTVLDADAMVIGETVFDFFDREQARLHDERARADTEMARMAACTGRVRAALGVGPRGGLSLVPEPPVEREPRPRRADGKDDRTP